MQEDSKLALSEFTVDDEETEIEWGRLLVYPDGDMDKCAWFARKLRKLAMRAACKGIVLTGAVCVEAFPRGVRIPLADK